MRSSYNICVSLYLHRFHGCARSQCTTFRTPPVAKKLSWVIMVYTHHKVPSSPEEAIRHRVLKCGVGLRIRLIKEHCLHRVPVPVLNAISTPFYANFLLKFWFFRNHLYILKTSLTIWSAFGSCLKPYSHMYHSSHGWCIFSQSRVVQQNVKLTFGQPLA